VTVNSNSDTRMRASLVLLRVGVWVPGLQRPVLLFLGIVAAQRIEDLAPARQGRRRFGRVRDVFD